jgi:hypothetical protein
MYKKCYISYIDLDFVKDKFGISYKYPTVNGGREYYSAWDNSKERIFNKLQPDPSDPEGYFRGIGKGKIDGKGVLTMTGEHPRYYVYDRARTLYWENVEITCYCLRVSENDGSIHDFRLAARTNHQDCEAICNSCAQGYIFELNFNGRIQFRKEVFHEKGYAEPLPVSVKKWWETNNGQVPKNIWIGMKFVVQTCDGGKHVRLEGYRDMSDGENGGDWGNPLIEYIDKGGWTSNDITEKMIKSCKDNEKCHDRMDKKDPIILRKGLSCYVRTDYTRDAKFKKLSIREISSLP